MSAEVISMEEFKSGYVTSSEMEEIKKVWEWGATYSEYLINECDSSTQIMALLENLAEDLMIVTTNEHGDRFTESSKEKYKQDLRNSLEDGFERFENPHICPQCSAEQETE